MVAPSDDRDQAKPAPKERVAPKLGLQGMVTFMMGLRQRGRMRNGMDAGATWVRLDRADLEKLEDIADTLEYFRVQRAIDRAQEAQNRERFRRR